jgi:biopolymer transport protein ExbD
MIAKKRFGKKKVRGALMLTSLVDILTILLIFLLRSFSPQGAILYAAQEVELPESTSPEGVTEGDLIVALSEGGVTIGEESVAGREDLVAGDGLLVPPLASALVSASGGEPGGRRVLIEGDRGVPFGILYRVLFTCHQSGYQDLALAAVEKEPVGGGTP